MVLGLVRVLVVVLGGRSSFLVRSNEMNHFAQVLGHRLAKSDWRASILLALPGQRLLCQLKNDGKARCPGGSKLGRHHVGLYPRGHD